MKQQPGKETLTRNASKMAAAHSSRTTLPQKMTQKGNSNPSSPHLIDTDSEFRLTPISLQDIHNGTDLLSQFERVLQKALQNTSDTITEKLTREIREVGRRT